MTPVENQIVEDETMIQEAILTENEINPVCLLKRIVINIGNHRLPA